MKNKNDKFDKYGNPLELMAWAKLLEDKEYSRVAMDVLPNGLRVSTVWLGTDHNFGEGKPLIFETMVFGNDMDLVEEYQERYSTLKEAEEGHKRAVDKFK